MVFSIVPNRDTGNHRIRDCVNSPLKIEINRVFGVFLDEGLARLDLLTHEDGEYLVGLDRVLKTDAAQGARFGVHGRLPQLMRVHFTKALEARNIDLCVRIVAAKLGGVLIALLRREGKARRLAARQ